MVFSKVGPNQNIEITWQLWDLNWILASIGKCKIMSRVFDSLGNSHPEQHDENYRSYQNSSHFSHNGGSDLNTKSL